MNLIQAVTLQSSYSTIPERIFRRITSAGNLQTACTFQHPNNRVKALKEIECKNMNRNIISFSNVTTLNFYQTYIRDCCIRE